ncbi:MAG: threonine ammonia-lyase [Bdellovibrionales bacterium]
MSESNKDKVITFDDVVAAQKLIKEHVIRTQVSYSGNTSQLLGCDVFFKHENDQKTGSFKVRGALNKIGNLSESEQKKGIVASSAGNHAQGVAYSSHRVGVPAKIVMPKFSPLIKAKATEHYGAEVIFHGEVYDDAYEYARQLEAEYGYTFVHAFNDPHVIAGQGTAALEIMDQIDDLDSIVVAIGGGGLISGLATVLKHVNPKIKIYGVVSAQAPNMLGLFKNTPEKYPYISGDTIADGIAVKKANAFVCDNYIKKLVDDIITVTDDEICEAMVWMMERTKSVVEGCSAAVLAGAIKSDWDFGQKTCLFLSGGNVDLKLLTQIIERGMIKLGRLSRIKVLVSDRPGQLHALTHVLAHHQANVLEVHHDRLGENLRPKQATMEFLIECKGKSHLDEIKMAIKGIGAQLL